MGVISHSVKISSEQRNVGKEWSKIRLGEILTKSDEWVTIEPGERYRQVTVRLWGKGVILRAEVSGAEIASTRQLVVRRDQFILSRIDARNGAFGLIPDTLDGAVVSNDFPAFVPDTSRIVPAFLSWISRTSDFVELCKAASEGTTNRVRLQENRFLAIEILLPPLEEQQRIVARIDELAGKIEEAQGLSREVAQETNTLWRSILSSAFMLKKTPQIEETATELLEKQSAVYANAPRVNYNSAHPWKPNRYTDGLYELPPGWVWTDLGSVLTYFVDCVNDTPDFSSLPTGFLGLKSTNVRPYKLELTERWYVTEEDFIRWNRRERPKAGDIILTREAPMGNACTLPEQIEVCLTQRLMLLRCDQAFVDSRYMLHFLNSLHFQNQILEQCRGLTTPHIRVGDAPFLKVPLAPLSVQRSIVAHLDNIYTKIETMKQMQKEAAAELDALLPSVLNKAFRGEL